MTRLKAGRMTLTTLTARAKCLFRIGARTRSPSPRSSRQSGVLLIAVHPPEQSLRLHHPLPVDPVKRMPSSAHGCDRPNPVLLKAPSVRQAVGRALLHRSRQHEGTLLVPRTPEWATSHRLAQFGARIHVLLLCALEPRPTHPIHERGTSVRQVFSPPVGSSMAKWSVPLLPPRTAALACTSALSLTTRL